MPRSFTDLTIADNPEYVVRQNRIQNPYCFTTEGAGVYTTPEEAGRNATPFGLLYLVNRDGGGIEKCIDPARPKEFSGWLSPLGCEVATFEAAKPVKPYIPEVDHE